MMWINTIRKAGGFLLVFFFLCKATSVEAQPLTLDFEIDETLENSQLINAQFLLANNLQGPPLYRLYLKNESSSDYLNNLYLRIVIESDKIGRILEVKQAAGRPFSLDPGQQVFATNNNSANGLPGIEEAILFDRNFSREGKSFYNELKGSTTLPQDRYQVMVEVYQGSTNGELLASVTDEVGTKLVEDVRDFYLLAPGDELGSEAIVSSRYPNFQWQGALAGEYRLVVVEARDDESPQSLIQGALNTDPISVAGTGGGGSLIDHEMLDVLVAGAGYQYPNSGVQNLKAGTEYYWQIIRQLETSNGLEQQESEIWSFMLADLRNMRQTPLTAESKRALEALLGDRFEELRQGDFSFESLEVNGQTFRSGQAIQKLLELLRKSNQGDVSIVIED